MRLCLGSERVIFFFFFKEVEGERERGGESGGGSKGRETERGSLLLCLCCQKDSDERTHVSSSAGSLCSPDPSVSPFVCFISTGAGEWFTADMLWILDFSPCLLHFYLILALLTQRRRKERGCCFWERVTLFNWRQTDCSKHLRDFKTVYIFFPFSSSFWNVTRFSSVNTQTSHRTFVCAFVCFFLLYECESDTEFIWKLYPNICASLHPCMWACVLISECFKCYSVPAELFIISICVCMLVCLLCIHHRSRQTCLCLFLFFLNFITNMCAVGKEKHCFPPF